MSAFGDEDICRFNVTVNYALAMGRIERFGNLNSQPEHLFQFQRTARDQVLEGDAVQIFHDDVGLAVQLADVMDGADIWMVQRRCSLGLAAKAGQRLWIASNFFRKEFERNKPMQTGVFGLIDDTHAAAAELFNNFVVGNVLADHWRKSYVAGEG